MTTKELNNYVMSYLKNDKTQRAIMLTATWGSGKSYYIKNDLCPFLLENKLDYAVVSLYGLKDIKELNKELFLEIKFRKSQKNRAKAFATTFGKTILSGAVGVGKTLLKNLVNVDIDINLKEPNYEKLYKSVNLKDKLIIFEDVERSGIDLIEFLGYVNNIVEQDGIKVLIVVNENEILEFVYKKDNVLDKEIEVYTEETKRYLKIKEKTISDTIQFASDYYTSIKSIIEKFDNKYLKLMLEEKDENGDLSLIRRIKQQLIEAHCINYRSLLFACQKMEDMLNLLDDEEYDVEFIENLFIGTVAYSLKFNNGNEELWEEVSFTSTSLGCYAYPLYKIMYDFIKYHIFNIYDFKDMQQLYLRAKDISQADETLRVIYNYYVLSEKEVKKAIDVLYERLKKNQGIAHNEYVKIANYLISIKNVFDYDGINKCLDYMLINTKKALEKGEEVQVYASSGIQLLSQEEIKEFDKFKSDMLGIVEKKKKLSMFDYKPETIPVYYESIVKGKQNFINERGFANKLDIDRLLDMLKNCSSREIYDFRGILQYVYMGISNIGEFLYDDIDNLIKIKDGVDMIIDKNENMDSIQILQMNYLSNNLGEIIRKLQGGKNEIQL